MFRISGLVLIVAAGLMTVGAADAQTLTTLASFNGSNGDMPVSSLTLSGNTLYGTTFQGGAYGNGAVFSLPVGGGSPTVLASFRGGGYSGLPIGGLTLSGNTLYGTAMGEGAAVAAGTVFSLPVGGGSPTLLASFGYSEYPSGGVTLSGNTLYGTTVHGGPYDDGTVFSLPVGGGSPTVLASFNVSNGQWADSGVTLSGNTLYGTTVQGGANNCGTVFSVPVGGGGPTVLASFSYSSTGCNPEGGLTLSPDGNTLYGTTQSGGPNGGGTAFSLPVGGGSPTVLASFSFGSRPYAGLTFSADDTTLYGTTYKGGTYGYGSVFSLPVGGGSPTVLASFDISNGYNVEAGLTLNGNTLYGTAGNGGAYGYGTVFALTVPEPSTVALLLASAVCLLAFAWRRIYMFRLSGLVLALVVGLVAVEIADAQTLTTLASFNGSNGLWPQGGVMLSGNTLFGTTYLGGADNYGTVFSVPMSGGSPTVLASFNGGGDGAAVVGDLTLNGSTLYGTAYSGGPYGYGTVFSVPVSGGSPTVLASFNGSNGEYPNGPLMLSGNTLYGTTLEGGAYGYGTVFSIPVSGGSPTLLASFNISDGSGPSGGLTLSGSTLYGTTQGGGANGDGTVFSVPVSGGSPTLLASFNGSNGFQPYAGLTLSGNTLYGTTISGGGYNDGTVFSVSVSGGSPTLLASFNGSNGSEPFAGLTLSTDGSTLYGTTEFGGAYGTLGTVFSVPVSGGSPTVLASFNVRNGRYPLAGLTLSGNTLYGTTEEGGVNNDGTVFALTVPEPSTITLLLASAACLFGFAWRRRTMRNRALMVVALASVLTMTASVSRAQGVFNMPSGETSLQFVTVGDPGNAPDTAVTWVGTTGYGSVSYAYQMGKYDVTVGQYCQFLNAVAATDAYGLYYSGMARDYSTVGIVQSGNSGSYTYSVSYTASAWNSYVAYNSSLYPSALAAANDAPVFDISWGDAARFANWLQNGQPTNLGEAAGSTETGAYTLDGAVSQAALAAINRNVGATYFIPSENEWYKAAYYKGGGTNAGYWIYPTQSNTAPSNVLSSSGTNNANYEPGSTYTDPSNILTPVGAFSASPGPFGTFDMGGDVSQWNELIVSWGSRGLWGGFSGDTPLSLSSSGWDYCATVVDSPYVGFRVAASVVPEPSPIALLLASAACLLGFAWRRRKRNS